MTKKGIGSLPNELLVRILSLLDFREIVRYQAVCKYFHDLIAESVNLQYIIELAVANCVDGPASNPLSTQERLDALRRHEDAWTDPSNKFKFITDIDTTHHRGVLNRGVYGGVVLTAYEEGIDPNDPDENHIGWHSFNRINVSCPALNDSYWLAFDITYTSCVADPGQDLLIVWYESSYRPDTACAVLSLRTGLPHPLSRRPLPVNDWGGCTGAHIFGSWFAVTDENSQFLIIDWHSGSVLLCQHLSRGNSCILSESCVVASSGHNETPHMKVFVIIPADTGEGLQSFLVADYGFPTTGDVLFLSFARSTSYSIGTPLHSPPFYVSRRMQLLIVHVGFPTDPTIFIFAEVFHKAAACWRPGFAIRVLDWREWMPEATWCITDMPYNESHPDCADIQCGYRVVLPTRVLDFNPVSIARDLCRRRNREASLGHEVAPEEPVSTIRFGSESRVHGYDPDTSRYGSTSVKTTRPYRETNIPAMIENLDRSWHDYMVDSNFIVSSKSEGVLWRVMGVTD